MIFRRKPAQDEPDEHEQEQVDHLQFQGALNGVQPNLAANGRLVQASLVPTKDLLTDAVLRRAEMVRIDPKGPAAIVRLYVDGIPYPAAKMPKAQGLAITQMIKLLGGMDIQERNQPQSGGMKAEHDGIPYELRVQSAPAEGAERLIVRIENLKTRPESPDDLNISQELRDRFRALTADKGALLVCGTPGSGVTSTTFGVLRSLDPYTRNILTLGDPGGRKLIAINPFEWDKANGIEKGIDRAMRTEPDVLYLDPIRNAEMAQTVFKYAEQVTFVAELAAKDTVSGVGQLLQWAGDGAMIAEGLRGMVSVKLIRKLCEKCKQIFKPNSAMVAKLGLPPGTQVLYRPPRPPAPGTPEADTYYPCNKCGGLGYQGRTGIFELLEVNAKVKEVLKTNPTASALRQRMKDDDMLTLQREALRLVAEGVTSLEEVQRAFQQSSG